MIVLKLFDKSKPNFYDDYLAGLCGFVQINPHILGIVELLVAVTLDDVSGIVVSSM